MRRTDTSTDSGLAIDLMLRRLILIGLFILAMTPSSRARTQITPRAKSVSAASGQIAAVRTFADGPIVETYPSHKVWFSKVLFSPDGSLLAVVTSALENAPGGPNKVWIYDMRLQRCIPVVLPTGNLSHTDLGYVVAQENAGVAWGADNTLYVSDSYSRLRVAATIDGAKEISAFPAKIAAAFGPPQRPADDYTNMRRCAEGALVRDDQFGVTVESLKPKCNFGYYLMLRRRDGTSVRKIADIADHAGTLVDSSRKLVIYVKGGQFETAILGAFDLNTKQSQELALPTGRDIHLLDRAKDGIVAYSVGDSCLPEDLPVQTVRTPTERATEQPAKLLHLCFVKFP